ncbi:hypothetical protein QR680_013645 [Steinernema hermaphroditum]|uniref:Peptidase S1 domain-containing protein n=1 Tax=Steinernema hermaphroditum TaxID=289476 RepID=A0AA39I670_9BILA|nr:hypothetical protein QR680_013645 [Steinernema hermaphroditum]
MRQLLLLVLLCGLVSADIDCGRTPVSPNQNLIVGGKLAKPGSWPWQVYVCGEADDGRCHIRCGGTLIDEQWVLTSGQCIDHYTDTPAIIGVKAGVYNYHSDYEADEEEFLAEAIYLHPQYNSPKQFSHDLGLIKLQSPVQFNTRIQPVCIPKSLDNLVHIGTVGYITGWGSIYEGGPVSNQLRQAAVPFVDINVCQAAYPGQIDPDTMECAGKQGVDGCYDDNGGPLVVKHADTGLWYQAGIMSFKEGCARKVGVYSKPSVMCDFIEKTVRKKICKSV